MPQERRKRCERRQVDIGIRRETRLGAGRPVKHPGRNLQPTVRIGTAQAAAKNSATRPLDRRVNADPKTEPRMPWVQQFPKLGSVGVLKLSCTTRSGRTHRSDTNHQRPRCSCPRSPRGRLRYVDRLRRPRWHPGQSRTNIQPRPLSGGRSRDYSLIRR